MREIRTAELADLEAIEMLYSHLNPERPELTPEFARQLLGRIVDVDEFQLFLCFSGELLVASCMLVFAPNLMRGGRPHAFLENVVTHIDHRQKGHGKAVVEAAIEMAWERNAHQVLLFSARADPGVHEFYEKCGLQDGRKAGYVIFSP